ncbi:MAG: class II aldolase/adducin family protein, partial [Prolixibacteraceae bacterium]|nr:class II aldolase/adducin family protein [Prolixibacteraceae bacterium]
MIIDEPRVIQQIEAVKQVAAFLWEKGWAERNAGNISVNLTGLSPHEPNSHLSGRVVNMVLPGESAGMILFLTGKGKRLRALPHAPEEQACIIHISDDVSQYQYLWGGEAHEHFEPTSELLSHLAIHVELQRQKLSHRCVLHTHPSALIALSHHPVYGTNETLLNRALWGMLPEVKLFVPR